MTFGPTVTDSGHGLVVRTLPTKLVFMGRKASLQARNVPGGRQQSVSWIDANGNFWMFGGYNFDQNGMPQALNDLWEYNVTTKQWTWVSGANVVNQVGNYGTVGVAASTNVPGARWSSAAWSDLSGNLWMFGGVGYDTTAYGPLSDLWEFTNGNWVWVKGPNSVAQTGSLWHCSKSCGLAGSN